MARQSIALAFVTSILIFSGGSSSSGEEAAKQQYRIKPSDVVVPADVPLGQYRRSIQPFENWILICDENLKAKNRVCNVSQTIVDETGAMIFSWSLAATQKGQPFLILRTAPDAKTEAGISLSFAEVKEPLRAGFQGCSPTVCVGQVAVVPLLKSMIGKGAAATVSYQTKAGQTVTLNAPLKGLREAVASIK